MIDSLSFFGKYEWFSIGTASLFLLVLLGLSLIFRTFGWVVMGLLLIVVLFSVYMVFFNKKFKDDQFNDFLDTTMFGGKK
jgi:ATP/ADP translocase